MSAPSKSTLSWLPAIPCAKATEADLAAVESKFGIQLPGTLKNLFLDHSGDQVQPSTFWAQNVTNGKWLRASLGAIYPASKPKETTKNDDSGMSSYNVVSVNEMFNDDLLEDAEETPAAAAASSSSSATSPKSVPMFAFSESPNTGHLVTLDVSGGSIMVVDVTHRAGPWIAASSIDEFLSLLASPVSHETDDQDELTDHFGSGADIDDGEEEDMYACDGCLAEFKETDVRHHCTTCDAQNNSYDLCSKCKAKEQDGKSESDHPKNHTFIEIQGHAEEEEEEEKE